MKKGLSANKKGFSLVEAMIATAIFCIIVTSIAGSIFLADRIVFFSGEKSRAMFLAEGGLETARTMRDNDFVNLNDGTYGLGVTSGKRVFSGSSDTNDIFTRSVTVSSVDANTKKIQSVVNWNQGYGKTQSVTLESYLTNWRLPKFEGGGALVFGDGGTTSDAMKWRKYKGDGTWDTIASLADVDGTTTNRVLRAVRIYASGTRNEYVVLSRHYDGTKQYIYAQVYNGSSWGNVQMLSSWTANTFLNVQNFDGTYLDNGSFMAVYSDFTATPKFRVWDGSSWGSEISMKANNAYPNYMTVKARPGTNEVMVVFAGQGKRTETQYYNGNGYATANWTFTQHATNSFSNAVRFADFDWSPTDTTKGALVYETNVKYMTAKVFTANGSGGGSFSSAVNAPTQANNVSSVLVRGRKGANEFMACNDDNKSPTNLACYLVNSFTPTFNTPTNNLLTASSINGTQFSMDFGYRDSGLLGLTVYSDNANTPKMRTYTPSSNTFSAVTTMATLGSALYSDKIAFDPNGEDAMVLLANKNLGLFSIVFNGTTGLMYATPSGKALLTQGSNGSANTDHWYDFAWRRD